jgi:hypothetical protein
VTFFMPGLFWISSSISCFYIYRYKNNMFISCLERHLYLRKNFLQKTESKLVICVCRGIFIFRLLSDIVYILLLGIKRKRTLYIKHRVNVNYRIELYVIILLTGAIVVSVLEISDPILTGLFIWRLISIFFIHLDEILFLKSNKPSMESFSRTMIFAFINLIEVSLAYAYFYSLPDIAVFSGINRLRALGQTMQVFVSWSIADMTLCTAQTWVMLSQILFAIIFLLFFIGNISAFKYSEK